MMQDDEGKNGRFQITLDNARMGGEGEILFEMPDGSVRWVWNAISSGKELLQSEAKFFGPTTDDDMTKQGQPALSEVDQ